jgi:hypothetical protein
VCDATYAIRCVAGLLLLVGEAAGSSVRHASGLSGDAVPNFTDGGRFQTSLAAIDRMVEVLHQHDDDRAV